MSTTTMTSLVPKLPTEIIHLIIDALVEQSSGELGLRTAALHTCSRVSWLFHLHSQKHRFSHIYFRFDHNAGKRAKRLLQVLVPPRNHYLHPFIASVTFIVRPGPPTPREGRWSRNMRKITQVATASIRAVRRKLKRELDWISCAMIFLAGLDSLQEMTLVSYSPRETVNWQEVTRSMPQLRKVLWLAMHPGLRHLTFRNLLNLPVLYVLARSEPPPRLRKLTIDNSHFLAPSSEPYKDLPPSFSSMLQERLATVEELNWVCRGALPPWSNQLLSLTPTYSSLTAITVHLAPANSPTTRFLQLLLSASRNLQSLELHNVHASGPELNNLSSDYLTHFTALRHVGYKAKSTNTEYLRTQLDLFGRVLLSAQTPLPSLSTISVEILEFCTLKFMSDDFFMMMSREALHSSMPVTRRWPALDDALCNPNFVGLASVCFNVKLFVQTTSFNEHDFNTNNLQPFVSKVYEHPLADVQVAIKGIGGADAYDLWVFEADRE